MNKEQFATILNGRQYRNELSKEEELLAKENGLLVCFGASDDLLELRGIICDETGACDGGIALIVKKKDGVVDVMNKNVLEDIEDFMDDHDLVFNLPKVKIVSEWCPSSLQCSWLIKSDLPHATFDIMEDGELYCRGIIIDKADIENALSN